MLRNKVLFGAVLASGSAWIAIACGHSKSDGGTGGSDDGGGPTTTIDAQTGYTGGSGPGRDSGGPCVHGPFPSPDIYDSDCALDKDAYVKIANNYSTASGLSYRFGPDSTYFHPTMSLPTLPQVQMKICGNAPIPGPPEQILLYQIGNDCQIKNPGNYSSDEGIVVYNSDVPPDPVDGSTGAGGGVDNIQVEYFAYNVFYYMPSPAADFGTIPYAGQLRNQSWTTLANGPVHAPIITARGIAPPFGQATQVGYVAFNDGLIGTIGCNTEGGGTVTKLPDGMVPTAMGMTNGSEFLLATVWDTTNIKGKLAVFSIESDHQGDGDFDDGYYDFHAHLPGFPSTGNATDIKLLGMIDLPDMIAPSDIAVASNYQSAFFTLKGANQEPATFDITQESNWETFVGTGENAGKRSTGGFAVIASRSERKVTFVDLQPLFESFNKEYFTDFATFQYTQTAGNYGDMPNQWPYTFDATPKATTPPAIITTVDLDQIPTSLFAGRTGQVDPTKGIHALIGTMDGTLHIYSVGGLVDDSAANVSDIKEIGTLAVGNNPTNIAIRKAGSAQASQPDPVSGSTGDLEGTQVFVTVRGDRAVQFVQVIGGTGTIFDTLQDSRMIDPISVDDADHESFLSYILDVADLNGRQILGYRYGEITFPSDQSMYPLPQVNGKAVFEYGGSYGVQGTPWQISGTNVP